MRSGALDEEDKDEEERRARRPIGAAQRGSVL